MLFSIDRATITDCLCPYLLIAASVASDRLCRSWPTAGTNTAAGGMTANHQVPAIAGGRINKQWTRRQVCVYIVTLSRSLCQYLCLCSSRWSRYVKVFVTSGFNSFIPFIRLEVLNHLIQTVPIFYECFRSSEYSQHLC